MIDKHGYATAKKPRVYSAWEKDSSIMRQRESTQSVWQRGVPMSVQLREERERLFGKPIELACEITYRLTRRKR